MTPINPFAFTQTPVTGDLFIGREKQLGIIRDNVLAGKATFIVGLPRMGKTSLVKQCFLLEKHLENWVEQHLLAPIYMVVATNAGPASFWKSLATKIRMFLRKRGLQTDCLNHFHQLISPEDMYLTILEALDDIQDRLGLRFIMIFDEFDGVLSFPPGVDLFNKLRQLNDYGSVIACSRRTPDYIEKKVTGRHYFTDSADVLFVGLFSEREVEEYWNHFKGHFSLFSEQQFASYKSLVDQYVGRHPMLMSAMNEWLFSLSETSGAGWIPKLLASESDHVERQLRGFIKQAFLRQIGYVEEQGLKDAAVQLVVGSSHMIPSEARDLLLDYQFIRIIPTYEKKEVFGYEFGMTTADSLYSYVCFSLLTTSVMKDLYDPDIEDYELLKKTEKKLRELITAFLKQVCNDENPFQTEWVSIDDSEEVEEREIWERPFYQGIVDFKYNSYASDRFLDNLDSIRKTKMNRISHDCNPSFDRTEINMVTSTTLGQLWHVFIKWKWDDFFAPILDPEKAYLSSEWYSHVFNRILEWRNAANHYHEEEIPRKRIKDARDKAKRLVKEIEKWLAANRPNSIVAT